MSFLLLLFLSLLSVGLYADVECSPNPDGSWTCSGTGHEWNGMEVTNGMGVCKNCVAMTPSECQQIKDTIRANLLQVNSSMRDEKIIITNLRRDIEEVKSEGDSFSILDYTSFPANDRTPTALEQPQIAYFIPYHPGLTSQAYTFTGNANNSIANYYQLAIQPVLSNTLGILNDFDSTIDGWMSQNQGLVDFVDARVNCEMCQLEPKEGGGGSDVPGGGGGGGGGGDYPGGGGGGGGDYPGGGEGGGSSTNGCCSCDLGPCLEQLQALKEVVDKIQGHTSSFSNILERIAENVEDYSKDALLCLTSISNSVGRIDSYLRDDLDKYAKDLYGSVLVISNNVDGLQREYYEAMKYANNFEDKDGIDAGLNLVELQTNFMDYADYKNLPWASRVEMLLLNLIQPFQTSSSDDADADQVLDNFESTLKGLDPDSGVRSLSTASENVFNSIERSVQSVAGIFDGVYNPSSIRILEQDQWFGDTALTIKLSDQVVEPIRAVFRLIWAVAALFSLFYIWIFVVRVVLPAFNLVRKFVTHLVKA